MCHQHNVCRKQTCQELLRPLPFNLKKKTKNQDHDYPLINIILLYQMTIHKKVHSFINFTLNLLKIDFLQNGLTNLLT